MRHAVVARTVLLAVTCLLGACAGSGGDDGGQTGPRCTPPPDGEALSYTDNIQPIFDRSCAFSACHAGAPLGANLDLTARKSYRQLVNVHASQLPRKIRVIPGDPDNSYLVMKMEGTPGISAGKMPLNCPGTPPPGGSCLGPDDIPAIRQWITDCAPGPRRR